MLAGEQFERVRRLALSVAGIELMDRHRPILQRRCQRAGIADEPAMRSLLDAVERGDAAASQRLVGLITTSFTGFFRNPWHFDVAAEHAMWAVHRRGAARLWSAAAATGEEAYSLAMALIEVFRREDPPATVLATDISDTALEIARRGEYAQDAIAAVEPQRRSHFFEQAARPGRCRIADPVRRLVEFRPLNLMDTTWDVQGPLDVICCRNVLMYLEARRRCVVLERMASLLAPGGVLLVDPVENVGEAGRWFGPGTNGVYSLRRNTLPGKTGQTGNRLTR